MPVPTLTTVLESVRPGLISYARRRVGPQNAEDIASETAARAVAAQDNCQSTDEEGIRRWVYAIARNVVRERKREIGKHYTLVESLRAQAESDTITETAAERNRLQTCTDLDRRKALAAIILNAELSRVQYTCLVAWWFGAPTSEIAHNLGIAESTVRVNLHHARAAIRHNS